MSDVWEQVDPITVGGITYEVEVQRDDEGAIVHRRERAVPTVAQVNEAELYDRLSERIAYLEAVLAYQGVPDPSATLAPIIAAPDLPAVPAGTLTTAQLSDAVRVLRNAAQDHRSALGQIATILNGARTAIAENRTGVKGVATIVRDIARYLRRDFGTVD